MSKGKRDERIRAIETRYAGHLFRSRLEARWAAWFDEVGVHWTYEPFDTAGYIPDFLCQADDRRFIVEVKGSVCDATELHAHAAKAAVRCWDAGHRLPVVIVGCDPDFRTETDGIACGVVGVGLEAPDFYSAPDRKPIEVKVSTVFRAFQSAFSSHGEAWALRALDVVLSHESAELDEVMSESPEASLLGGPRFSVRARPWWLGAGFTRATDLQMAWGRAHETARWMPIARE